MYGNQINHIDYICSRHNYIFVLFIETYLTALINIEVRSVRLVKAHVTELRCIWVKYVREIQEI